VEISRKATKWSHILINLYQISLHINYVFIIANKMKYLVEKIFIYWHIWRKQSLAFDAELTEDLIKP